MLFEIDVLKQRMDKWRPLENPKILSVLDIEYHYCRWLTLGMSSPMAEIPPFRHCVKSNRAH